MYFNNPIGLWLLLFAIALIIMYMIKAKPKQITIPSLIFFSSDTQVKKYNSILRKLLLRALFFLQLAFILAIAFSSANPIISFPIDAFSLNTVVVIDVSGSMTTKEGTIQRIDLREQDLLKSIKGRSSIILAEENPVVMATNISSRRAKALISRLEPKNTRTRLDSSILLANELLGDEKGTILVYSDFNTGKEDDIIAAKKIAESNDKKVVFMKVGSSYPNLGFNTLNLNLGKGEAFVKNYGDRKEIVDVKFINDNKIKETKRIEVKPNSIERIGFDIEKGETMIELSQKDRLEIDDKLYIMNPYKDEIRVLFITSNQKDNPLLNALLANSRLKVDIAIPPVIPSLEQDVVVISDVNRNFLLPNTFKEIKRYKDEGGKVILADQTDLESLKTEDLLDLKVNEPETKQTEACIDIINDFTARISNPRCFASINRYHKVEVNQNSVALVSTKEGIPLFILEEGLFYYGINDKYSGFKDQINYPLFWDDVINYLLGRESISNFNLKTGDTIIIGNNTKAVFDTVGFHESNGRKIAVNLLNDQESNIFNDPVITDEKLVNEKHEKVNLDVDLDQILLIIAIILFISELYYIKKRGDI